MSNTKRIAKNTVVLYLRMIIVMLIALYTSRIVLKALGVDDYGLYNVVGGVIGLLTFFNVSMSKSTQRFLNVSMEKGNDTLSSIFASSLTVHILFAVLFFLLGETIGLWFLNTRINIPVGRETAANIVYQASILSFSISIITTSYSAVVVAYEEMKVIAIVSILDALLKLGIAVMLLFSSRDRLALYGVLLTSESLLMFLYYFLYCKKKHSIFKFHISFDKENFKHIFGFVSWTLVGQFAIVACNQGNVILVNFFHSLSANAAMAVGSQVNSAIQNLTNSFQSAFNPQITKSYAVGDYNYVKTLVYITSKISFCIMFAVVLPVVVNVDLILDIWLDKVPFMANSFSVLCLVNGIVNAVSAPFHFVVLSSGKIARFQLLSALLFIVDIPIVYSLFQLGCPLLTVMYVKIGVIVAVLFLRIRYASKAVKDISFSSVCIKVLFPMMVIVVSSLLLIMPFYYLTLTIVSRITLTVIVECVILALMWFICFSKNERLSLVNMVKMLLPLKT